MEFHASFFEEEIRSGFLVTEKRKKIWAVELEILEIFDDICRKHGLTWYAYYGTLLGAVRHQGFIPWDDDIDVVMFRDDYERFKTIASQEIEEPYFFQNLCTKEMLGGFCKIRDSRTTAIEFQDVPLTFHQGIFIDIFPFDSVSDGVNTEFSNIANLQRALWAAVVKPSSVLEDLEKNGRSGVFADFLLDFMQRDVLQRIDIFEAFSLSQFGKTQNVNFITSEIYGIGKSVPKDWMKDVVYLPFENMQIPAPAEYDKILIQCYGDYHQTVRGASDHEGVIFEPDIPYKDYFARYLKR